MLTMDIEELILRIRRIANLLNEKYGDGIQLEVITPESNKFFYEIKGVKSLAVYKDEILSLAIWVWSFKDYIKEILRNTGRDYRDVENLVNNDNNLQVCADIANRAKHLKLKISRSGLFPKWTEPNASVKFKRSDPSIDSISFTKNKVTLDVRKNEYVDYSLPIYDSNNNHIGNAEDIIKDAFNSFINFLSTNNIIQI